MRSILLFAGLISTCAHAADKRPVPDPPPISAIVDPHAAYISNPAEFALALQDQTIPLETLEQKYQNGNRLIHILAMNGEITMLGLLLAYEDLEIEALNDDRKTAEAIAWDLYHEKPEEKHLNCVYQFSTTRIPKQKTPDDDDGSSSSYCAVL